MIFDKALMHAMLWVSYWSILLYSFDAALKRLMLIDVRSTELTGRSLYNIKGKGKAFNQLDN